MQKGSKYLNGIWNLLFRSFYILEQIQMLTP